MACNTNKTVLEEEKVPFNNKILVTLKPDVTADELVDKYQEYSLSYKGQTSKSTNSVLFLFDDTKISHRNMLALLNKDKGIVKASGMKRADKTSQAGRSARKGTPVDPIK